MSQVMPHVKKRWMAPVLAGFAIGFAFWLLDSAIHRHVLPGGFAGQILHPASHDLWMRIAILFGSIFFTFAFADSRRARDQFEFARYVLDNAGDPLFLIDREGYFAFVNDAACQHLGYQRQELLRMGVPDIDPLFPQAEWKRHWEDLVEKEMIRLETKHLTKAGDVIPVDVNAKKLRFNGVEYNCAFVRNITARKDAERALRDNERMLQTIIETAPSCIKLLGSDGSVLSMNRAGLAMIQAESLEQVRGASIYELIAPEFREQFRKIVEDSFDGRAGVLEFRAEGLKGRSVWLETRAVPLRNEANQIIASLGITSDITKRKEADDSFKRYAADLAEANKLKDLFTDILRHDILNPVSVIKSSAEVLLRVESDLTKTKLLNNIRHGTSNLTELAENAAKYAKLATLQTLEFESVDLNQSIRRVLLDFEHLLEEKGIGVDLLFKGEAIMSLNPMIRDVFANLISNAIKYSPTQSKIEIAIDDQGASWIVAVKDHGDGISDQNKQRIFNRFERLGKEGVKGSGLGLAIAKQIVDLHQGNIWVEDNSVGGSVFRVQLPKERSKARK